MSSTKLLLIGFIAGNLMWAPLYFAAHDQTKSAINVAYKWKDVADEWKGVSNKWENNYYQLAANNCYINDPAN